MGHSPRFTSDEQRFVQLQEELARCQQLLESEKAQNGVLNHELSNNKQTISLLEKDLLNPRLAERSASRQNKSRQNEDLTYMIKHMGRLVHDEMGVGRFAGSTTGIHFVLTVEQQCQKVLNLPTGFPESCFRLFLAQTSPIRQNWITDMSVGDKSEFLGSFSNSLSYYLDQADRFINEWEAYCPVLVRRQLMSDIRHTMETLHGSLNFQELDPAMLLTLTVILIINELDLDSGQQTSSHYRYLHMAGTLINDIRARGDIKGLQALALCSLYYQLSGDCLGMTRINGIMVSLAQSLGLHRHSRRFKMKPCEIELRKRLWWWIYSFDSVTSLIHGLPSLINDVDVDCDMPTDCHMDDLDAAEPSHPLPGERTAVFLFIQYVALGKILSRIREMLYTTTQRRNGATKINDLTMDLRMWNQNLKMTGIIFDIGTIPSPFLSNESADDTERTVLWLQLLANIAMVLINRPGLSFDDTTVEFANCLRACVASSTVNLLLLKEIQAPNWLRNPSLKGVQLSKLAWT
ncbi:uncharacterized protein N7483_001615 [Penicillium malachiteum]|uniref:uncharacterized protein n=1 Tax=Penicillium malachiteum TaxID=1324776 RepID=UPI002548AD98|nr:uncharacterized protein N7483_001615 [Penicillium malachiteum]KAJ5736490.1 hypothetical protein N7483_001615 [Penicillium malachiteum]